MSVRESGWYAWTPAGVPTRHVAGGREQPCAAAALQEQLDAEQQHMADEVGAAQSAARVDVMRREDELRAARGRAAELDAALLQEQADAQRLRDEHEHQVLPLPPPGAQLSGPHCPAAVHYHDML